MAKAALENALWDAEAQQNNQTLSRLLSGTRSEIACGVSIGIQDSHAQLLEKIETELAAGYQRIKVKVKPSWDLDVLEKIRQAYAELAGQCALQLGLAQVADANAAATALHDGDLVFIDPPYSGVHYSRFYHVLESIAQGTCGAVSGVGRYPSQEFRPRSKYSVGSESVGVLDELLGTVASRGARGILTFPDHECSNGLSGETVRELAKRYFRVREKSVAS